MTHYEQMAANAANNEMNCSLL